jgi:endogenous inhibitor of DNA gyrase (YacG/DUF329 family)
MTLINRPTFFWSGKGGMAKPTKAKCPICGKAVVEEFRPFCSKRCANVDLGRWLGGGYRIETEEQADPYQLPANDDNADDR